LQFDKVSEVFNGHGAFSLKYLNKQLLYKALETGVFLLMVAVVCRGFYLGAENLGYNWQWYRIPRYLGTFEQGVWQIGPLLRGLLITLKVVMASLLLSLIIGLLVALMRLTRSPVARALATFYLELVRNTPLLVQIFLIYFVLSPILGIERFAAAVLALSLFEGAYASEIFRAGILAIPLGQWEAAASLGMAPPQRYWHIVLPQALRNMAPPLTSQGISLIKDSALVSTIAIYDLSMRGQQLVSESFLTFEVWFTIALIYLCLTLSLSAVVRLLEWRLDSPGA
jgi:polar amino acid transport system permease protein